MEPRMVWEYLAISKNQPFILLTMSVLRTIDTEACPGVKHSSWEDNIRQLHSITREKVHYALHCCRNQGKEGYLWEPQIHCSL